MAVLGCAWLAAQPAPTTAQNARTLEASALNVLRANFLIRLVRFVHWPESSFASQDSAVELCVMAEQPEDFARLLQREAAAASPQRRRIDVRMLRPGQPAQACHLVYALSGAELPPAKSPRYVHVVDSLSALERGGMLALVPEYTDEGRTTLRFHGRRERLRGALPLLNAQLLKLVRFPESGP